MSGTTSDCPANQQPPSADVAVCRDFLRNVCKRGRRCKFVHPTQLECEKIRRSERIFCHDFQNSVCRRPACKFLHYSREDEEIFRLTGHLPDEVDSKGDGSQATAIEESPPICKVTRELVILSDCPTLTRSTRRSWCFYLQP
ncbi:hypothetical protein AHF37_09735 [Paragonimus kellicotti]|nr:hypothetical protein AHF37_09735 [Paragonimus kellicotti]